MASVGPFDVPGRSKNARMSVARCLRVRPSLADLGKRGRDAAGDGVRTRPASWPCRASCRVRGRRRSCAGRWPQIASTSTCSETANRASRRGLLLLGEQRDAGVGGCAARHRAGRPAAAVPAGGLLDAAAALVQSIAGQAHDVEPVSSIHRPAGRVGASVHENALAWQKNWACRRSDPTAHGRASLGCNSLTRARRCLRCSMTRIWCRRLGWFRCWRWPSRPVCVGWPMST